MLIEVTCPYCGATGRLREDAQGHRILCPRCGMRFDLQTRPEAAPDLPPAVIDAAEDQRGGADFGHPAQSGFYESPTIDADLDRSEDTSVPRRTVLAIRGTQEWGDWLASVSKLSGQPAAVLVEKAIAEWATRHGYPAPPRR
jgi:hypothetical protein